MDPDPDPDPDVIDIDLQDANKKTIFKKCLLLFKGTLASFFKDKKSKRSHKTVGIHTSDYWIQIEIQEAQKHTDPTDLDPDSDPDPQHCFL
jgi:hypothetical protein